MTQALIVVFAVFAIFGVQTLFDKTMAGMDGGHHDMPSAECVSVCLSSVMSDVTYVSVFTTFVSVALIFSSALILPIPHTRPSQVAIRFDQIDPRLRLSTVRRE